VALAHRLGLPLITADEALRRKLEGTPYDVRWLGDFPFSLESKDETSPPRYLLGKVAV